MSIYSDTWCMVVSPNMCTNSTTRNATQSELEGKVCNVVVLCAVEKLCNICHLGQACLAPYLNIIIRAKYQLCTGNYFYFYATRVRTYLSWTATQDLVHDICPQPKSLVFILQKQKTHMPTSCFWIQLLMLFPCRTWRIFLITSL